MKRQRRRETLPDVEWWQEIRDSEIEPILRQATEALNKACLGGKVERKNGGSGLMIVVVGNEDDKFHLTFTHAAANTIKITSSETSLDETCDDRKHIIPENIINKVHSFLTLVTG